MDCDHFLKEKGFHVLPSWTQQWQRSAQNAVPGFCQRALPAKQDLLYQEVLRSNLHLVGQQALPADLQGWHKKQLQGLFVLQVDEVINIAAAAKHRYDEAADKRCLRLTLTDGVPLCLAQTSKLPFAQLMLSCHIQIAIKDATVRQGTLLLTADNVAVLGGQVDVLEVARQKTLKRWNQPASGRTSRNDSEPTDLYAEASAAAWQAEDSSSIAPTGLQQIPAARPATSHSAAAQSTALPGHGPLAGTLAANQTISAQRASHARMTLSRPPFTPSGQLQPQQQLQAGAEQSSQQSVAPARPISGMHGTSAQLQCAVNSHHGPNVTPAADVALAQQSNQMIGQQTLPLSLASRSGTTQTCLAASHQPSALPRSRLALSGRETTPSQASQQASALPQVPSQPSHTPPSAAAHVMPSQPQQDLIVIDDSPQPSCVQPRSQHLAGAAAVEDVEDMHAVTQPGKRQRRQLIDSSSDSDDQPASAKVARINQTGQASGSTDLDHALENEHKNGSHATAAVSRACAHDIVPDSCADIGGFPEACEDYGNEPVFGDECEQADEANDDVAEHGMDEGSEWEEQAAAQAASPRAVDTVVSSPKNSQQTCNEPMEVSDSPDHAGSSDEAAASKLQQDRSNAVIEATEALFSLPYTTLSNIAKYAPQMPVSEFPMVLRINSQLGHPLSPLRFRDGQGHELPEYSIDMGLSDATMTCTAIVGHDILLQAVGMLPASFNAKFIEGKKPAVVPALQRMSEHMSQFAESAMLTDIKIDAPGSQPVILHIHKQWTKADKEAIDLQ